MLITPEKYKRGRGGGIKTTARVFFSCDECGTDWGTQYSNYKKKNSIVDLCQSCKNIFGICGMLGKKHSKKTCEKFKKRVGDSNGFFRKNHSDNQKAKWSKSREGKPCRDKPMSVEEKKRRSKIANNYWRGLSEEEKVTRLSFNDYSLARKNLLKNGGRYSKLHQKVKNEMEIFGLGGFKSEEKIGSYIVDEVCFDFKIAIEINGDYWHANPKKYKSSEIISYPKGLFTAASVWQRDELRIKNIESMGFKVFIIWENDIKNINYLSIFKEIKNEM